MMLVVIGGAATGPVPSVPMTSAHDRLLARAQHAVDEIVPEGVRVEVLDGAIIVNPPPSPKHGRVVFRLAQEMAALVPAELTVDPTGIGVYEHDHPDAEYQVPDVTVYRSESVAPLRLTGAVVELAAEVISPANRRQRAYEQSIVERAGRYGIAWVLVIDPDAPSARWWHDGIEVAGGPSWTAGLDLDAVLSA